MSTPLWTSGDIALATGGRASAAFNVTGTISIDSRSLKPGDLFVALSDQRDGHDFAEAAFQAGAAGALVSRPVGGGPSIIVPDTLAALENLGLAARARSHAMRVAVTGSAGKTSVKEMLARIFRVLGPAHWSEKSFNNHWGVPLTLARMRETTERAIFEIGMSTPGEIAPRSQMVRPHVAIVTCIASAHLEGLGSIEAIAAEKSGIFAGLEAAGTAILPADDAFCAFLAERARGACASVAVETFGRHDEATARIVSYRTDGHDCEVTVDIVGQRANVLLHAVGEHWAFNAAAALLAASRTGRSLKDCADALSGYAPPSGRGVAETLNLPQIGEITLIDDAYNANPASMRAALSGLAERPGARRLAALGVMLEIGETSAAEHAALAGPLAEAGVEAVFLAGDMMEHLANALPATISAVYAPSAEELWNPLRNALRSGDVLLIKGSNASGMSRITERLRQWSEAPGLGKMDSGSERAAKEG